MIRQRCSLAIRSCYVTDAMQIREDIYLLYCANFILNGFTCGSFKFWQTSKISLFFFLLYMLSPKGNSRLLVFHFSQDFTHCILCVVLMIMFPARGQSDIQKIILEKKNVVFVVLLKL